MQSHNLQCPSLHCAADRIAAHGWHTECMLIGDAAAATRLLREVDSAIVLHNVSTQFADSGEFGIATGRMCARGPVGVEQLCTFKYRVRGDGQVRA